MDSHTCFISHVVFVGFCFPVRAREWRDAQPKGLLGMTQALQLQTHRSCGYLHKTHKDLASHLI